MPLKIPYYEMDIPRLVTALADWLACLLYLRFLPPRYGGVKRAALYGGALAALALYLVATDGFNVWLFNVLYAVSVALMLLFMAAATRADRWQVGYFCTRAFILAGFAGGADMADVCIFCALHRSIAKPACVGALYCGGVHHLRPDVASGMAAARAAFSLTFGPATCIAAVA